MPFSRRAFLQTAAAGAAFTGFARLANAQTPPAETYLNEVYGYGPLKPDPYGVFDLPEGFSYRVVSQAGERMSDGLYTPFKFDGMGCFSGGGSRVILARNHELRPTDRNHGALGINERIETQPNGFLQAGRGKLDPRKAYDLDSHGHPIPGGVSLVTYDLKSGQTVNQHMALTGTAVNCAGGVTPWGSWLTCEETQLRPGESGASKSHGWVFEVPSRSRGLVQAVPLTAMGRFNHEACAIDPRTGVVYMTEDSYDHMGLFYRFLPTVPGKLHLGGKLQALAFKGGGDSRNYDTAEWRQGDWRETVWIDMDGVDAPDNDLAKRGNSRGATWFARGEGIHWGQGELYFCCSSGGKARIGQILRYVPSRLEGQPGEKDEPGRIQLFVEASNPTALANGDNITVAPWGHLILGEDESTKTLRNHLRGVTPDGKTYAIGRNVFRDFAELAGLCFSPDGSTLFLNIYWPGITLAIKGPWNEFRN